MNNIFKTIIADVELYDSAESSENPTGTIAEKGTEVKILETNLGNLFQYSKVEIEEVSYYARSCFLEGIDEVTTNFGEYSQPSSKKEISIKDATVGYPYRENGKLNLVVETIYNSIEDLEQNLTSQSSENLKAQTLLEFLDYYGKDIIKITEEAILEFALNPFGLIEVSKPYLSIRPGVGIKVKFSVEEKYIQPFQSMSFERFAIQNIHKDFISTNIAANKFDINMRKISKILDNYEMSSSKFAGKITGVNFKALSKQVINFISDFKKYFLENGVDLELAGSNKIELGFNRENKKLEYVMYYDPYGKFMVMGMNKFFKLLDIRLSKLLLNFETVLGSASMGTGWMDFLKLNFPGDYRLDFSPPNLNTDLKSLELNIDGIIGEDQLSSVLDLASFSGLQKLKFDPNFRLSAGKLLLKSRDLLGDSFLLNLPDILSNIDDLQGLFKFVLGKISIKDLTDIMIDKVGANLSIPDINEVKLRGILKILDFQVLLNLAFNNFSIPDLKDFNLTLCDVYSFGEEEFDKLLGNIKFPVIPIEYYMVHYDGDGKLVGLLVENYSGDLEKKLLEEGISDCAALIDKIARGNFNIGNYFQEEAVAKIICRLLSEGLPEFSNPCSELKNKFSNIGKLPKVDIPDLRIDIFNFFRNLDIPKFSLAIDVFFKELLEKEPTAYDRFIQIPEIKIEFGKLSLTKEKLLKRLPGIDLDFELPKLTANFELPNIKDVNPSFDFGEFEFSDIGDIFGTGIDSIESSIKEGIQDALVVTFKGILNRLLDSLNLDSPDLKFPDFGGLNINNLLDASNGIGAGMIQGIVLPDLEFNISKFDFPLSGAGIDISDLDISENDVGKIFDDISNSMKPLELIRVLKGLGNGKDYENISGYISDPKFSLAIDATLVQETMETITSYIDIDMLEEIEKAYDDEEAIVNVCENFGINYQHSKGLREAVKDKFKDFTDEDVDDLIESIADETKQSLVDAIGSNKNNFMDTLPFNTDPCTFMPSPSDIPAMNYANNIIFDTIFDSVEQEYKAEAAAVQDLFLVTAESEEYVKMFHYPSDTIIESVERMEDGTYNTNLQQVSDVTDEARLYNQEFSYNYQGQITTVYKKSSIGGNYVTESSAEITKNDLDEWETDTDYQLYVKKQTPTLKVLPQTRNILSNLNSRSFRIRGASSRYRNLEITFDSLNSTASFIHNTASVIQQPFDMNSGEFNNCLDPEIIETDIDSGDLSFRKKFRNKIQSTISSSISDKLSEEDRVNFLTYVGGSNVINSLNISDVGGYVNSWQSSDLISRMYSSFLLNILEIYKDSDLFNMRELLSFVIDDEGVNLLKLQDAKNDAKDSYNSQCSFAEGDDSLQRSMILKLIYLMIRIQVIEEVVKSSFLYNTAYDSKMISTFAAKVFLKIDKYLLKQENGFKSLFERRYAQEYNDVFSKSSKQFLEMVEEMYSDIAGNFGDLYRNGDDFNKTLLLGLTSDINRSGKNEIWNLATESVNSFLIQTIDYDIEGNEIEINALNATQQNNKAHRRSIRLCYVVELPHSVSGNHISYDTLRAIPSQSKYVEILQNEDMVNWRMLKKSRSYELIQAPDGDIGYFLLPLAETSLSRTLLINRQEGLVDAILKDSSEGTIMHFLDKYMGLSTMKELISIGIGEAMIAEKSEIFTMFEQTKSVIKKSIEMLDQDVDSFEFDETETSKNQLIQSQGVSTSPDFSSKAAKMALQTIPMIIKGAAEMFDPNIKIASKIRTVAQLGGVDIPPPAATLMALPINLVPFAPGPPIGPLGLLYLATAFLDPSERKLLSDMKRGRNQNSGSGENSETNTVYQAVEGIFDSNPSIPADQQGNYKIFKARFTVSANINPRDGYQKNYNDTITAIFNIIDWNTNADAIQSELQSWTRQWHDTDPDFQQKKQENPPPEVYRAVGLYYTVTIMYSDILEGRKESAESIRNILPDEYEYLNLASLPSHIALAREYGII